MLRQRQTTPYLYSAGAIEQLIAGSFHTCFSALPVRVPYQDGHHIQLITKKLTEVMDRLAAGQSSYVIISVPFRHGKTAMASWRFPAWALVRDPTIEVMLVSYGATLAIDNSARARDFYRELGAYYGLGVSAKMDRADKWRTTEGGLCQAFGLGGSVAGHGADLLIIDDYYKLRLQAESDTIRQRVLDSFHSDLMPRLGPIHAVVIVANRWHSDDLVAHILGWCDPKSETYDPDFPVFEDIRIRAEQDGRWLWPERYSETWYRTMRASMSTYAWQAQALQDPQPRHGNMLRVDRVVVADELPDGLTWCWSWDVASSSKERNTDDPDYTVGTRLAEKGGAIYVDHVVRGQWTALDREVQMKAALTVRSAPRTYIESVAGYKDAVERARRELRALTIVQPYVPKGDKVQRAGEHVERLFEQGQITIRRAAWNGAWLDEMRSFPNGKHDDQVDSLTIGVNSLLDSKGKMGLSR